MMLVNLLVAIAGSAVGAELASTVFESDVCVYGGTSGGVAAAIQAAWMGKKVVLIDLAGHLGGMTTSGLGATDIGNKRAIGGIAREFYKRLGKRYGKDEAWTFEPHVAEEVLTEMVRVAGVQVLEEWGGVKTEKDGDRIAEAIVPGEKPGLSWQSEKGVIFRAKVYIDATYEGDLMAAAGVSYTVGREANARYVETLDGVRAETPAHQFKVPVDPYVTPGDPSSGLLPLIQAGDGGEPGSGDRKVQAYNFRLCLTRNPANRMPIEPPKNYDPARYEVLARYLEALVAAGKTPKLGDLLSIIEMPNGKTDINNNGAVSTDFIGESWTWADADEHGRAIIWWRHTDYTRGLLHFLATSPRVPQPVRDEMGEWGLCKDEFTDSRGWPRQLYVREARRMVSDYVMTEGDCRGKKVAGDPVGLAAYNMDSHNCQRIVKGGRVVNEGDVQVGVSPYPISFRSIVPRAGEASNLLVPVCLSASHIAYGSIRMEPVFMILGQSAATAACLAIDAGCPVRAIDYRKLRERLLADGQVLEWKAEPAAAR